MPLFNVDIVIFPKVGIAHFTGPLQVQRGAAQSRMTNAGCRFYGWL